MDSTVYVFRAGPLDPDSEPKLYWYATIPDSQPPVIETDDDRGLAEVVRRFPGSERYCEPELADAAARAGFQAREPAKGEAMTAAILWLTVAFWQWYRGVADLDAKNMLLTHGANLWDQREAARSIIELRVAIRGGICGHSIDGVRYVVLAAGWGLFVFDSLEEMNAFQTATRQGDTAASNPVPRLHMHWERGPERHRALMQRAYGVDVVPVPSVDDGQGRRGIDDREAWLLTAIIAGASDWIDAQTPAFAGSPKLGVEGLRIGIEFLRAYVQGEPTGIRELGWDDFVAMEAG